jgi:hypothetical protein
MRQAAVFIIILSVFSGMYIEPLFAAGVIKRLTGLKASMDRMAREREAEGDNYQRAKEFIQGPEITEGLSKDDIIKQCGNPAAKADNGSRWAYKPPTSTFFKGEKIYFFFNGDGKLNDWEQVYQD